MAGTDSTGVPSSRWQGTSATTGREASRVEASEIVRAGEIGVGDDDAAAPAVAEVIASDAGGAVE